MLFTLGGARTAWLAILFMDLPPCLEGMVSKRAPVVKMLMRVRQTENDGRLPRREKRRTLAFEAATMICRNMI